MLSLQMFYFMFSLIRSFCGFIVFFGGHEYDLTQTLTGPLILGNDGMLPWHRNLL